MQGIKKMEVLNMSGFTPDQITIHFLREENAVLEKRLRVVEAYLKDRLDYIEVLISDNADEMGG